MTLLPKPSTMPRMVLHSTIAASRITRYSGPNCGLNGREPISCSQSSTPAPRVVTAWAASTTG